MMRTSLLFPLFLALGCAALLGKNKKSTVNAAGEAIDYLHGKKVEDPYRWMEHKDHPKLLDWIETQNSKTANYMKSIPFISRLHQRILDIAKTNPASYNAPAWQGGKLFALKTKPPLPQPVLARE
jgi:prolyl oligopeptidase